MATYILTHCIVHRGGVGSSSTLYAVDHVTNYCINVSPEVHTVVRFPLVTHTHTHPHTHTHTLTPTHTHSRPHTHFTGLQRKRNVRKRATHFCTCWLSISLDETNRTRLLHRYIRWAVTMVTSLLPWLWYDRPPAVVVLGLHRPWIALSVLMWSLRSPFEVCA